MLIPAGKFYVNSEQVKDVLPMTGRMIVIRWLDGSETPYQVDVKEFVKQWNQRLFQLARVNEAEAIRREYITPRRPTNLNPERYA